MALIARVFGVGAMVVALTMTSAAPVHAPGQPPVALSAAGGDDHPATSASAPFTRVGHELTGEPATEPSINPEPAPTPLQKSTEVRDTGVAEHQAPDSTVIYAPLMGTLYVDPTSVATREADRLLAAGRTADTAALRVIAEQPQAVWINGHETGAALEAVLRAHRDRATAADQRLVVVTYAIPYRDCGSHSAGGLTPAEYPGWNATIADALRGSGAIVIVEPDALPGVTSPACAPIAQSRPALIKDAVETLAAAELIVYIDAGHSNWVDDATMADLLAQAGIESARGFATNVSNYHTTASEREWAERVSGRLGGKRFVIDVSRNGNGPNSEWCNASGRALGVNPTLDVHGGSLDGLLWVKRPGESDGTCNGGPTAGHWWQDYAIGLVQRR